VQSDRPADAFRTTSQDQKCSDKGTVSTKNRPACRQSRGNCDDNRDDERATILVVDDEETIRRMMEKMLANSGCAVVKATSALAALEVMEVRVAFYSWS
jgi:PleD family two-component response regulator